MTLEQIIVLNAIVEQGTFRGAAEHLNKTQPAISHMLKKLEDELGFTVFSRENYRPALTEKGEVYYRHSLRVLQRVQDLKSVASMLNSEQEAEVALTVTATFPFSPILELIGAMASLYPTTHIRVARDNMGGALEKLLADEVQIAISTLDGVPLDRVEALPLTPVTILPVAHRDFPAARRGNVNSDAEMQTHIQVVVSDSGSTNKQSRGLLPGGLRWTVSDFATKKEILLANMGWGGMPQHMIQEELEQGDLVPLNVEGYPPVRAEHFVMRRRDITIGVVAQALWDKLKD